MAPSKQFEYQQTTICRDIGPKAPMTKAMMKTIIGFGLCPICQEHALETEEKLKVEKESKGQDEEKEPKCLFKGRRTFAFTKGPKLLDVRISDLSVGADPIWTDGPSDLDRNSLTECVPVPCNGKASHWLILIEPFRPGQAERALEIMDQTEPLERPANWDRYKDEHPIRFELTDGRGLPSYSDFYCALATGVPILITGLQDLPEHILTPEYLRRNFGTEEVTVINTVTGEWQEATLEEFLATLDHAEMQNPPLKIKDWPPAVDFRNKFPRLYGWFQKHLTGPNITTYEGNLNLESSMPSGSCPPDTGPKGYLAHGAAGGVSTHLHMDVTDATNLNLYARHADGTPGGAVWTTIHRDDVDRATDWLRKNKVNQFKGHPIHSQTIFLTDDDVERLKADKIRVTSFKQGERDAVILPARVPHQVANDSFCTKIAKDYIVPVNIRHSAKVGHELRAHRLATREGDGPVDGEDILQLNCMAWWFLQRSQLPELRMARSKPDGNPWMSRSSAAPKCLDVRVDVPEG
ncbi:unnamed protein product [Peniophora sp. CBMAI 1063]|nr:unnamed protein product [Peniophora sp. CBMAI 1063]